MEGDDVTDRATFHLTLRADDSTIDGTRAMRQLLKIALRRFGLRCVSVASDPPVVLDRDARGHERHMPTADQGER